MAATGMGLLLEEHRGEITSAWRQAVERETGVKEPALAFAVGPLLREISLAMGGGRADGQRARQALLRCAVLVRSSATPAQLAREVKILHRCTWAVLRARGAAVAHSERQAVDEWIDEALAEALDRNERVRLRMATLERGPVVVPPAARSRETPPPLPPRPRPQPQAARAQPGRGEPASQLGPLLPRSGR